MGPILLAAPELVAGGALPTGLGLAWTFETATPLTPVAFLHWSSERSWAEELNLMSAHYAWRISELELICVRWDDLRCIARFHARRVG
jgi:hypothetical protein